jgi:hypothetical protein
VKTPIEINVVAETLPERTNYRKTSPNQRLAESRTLLSFSSLAPGSFKAEGKGGGLTEGDVLYVSLKGSKTLSLPLVVAKISYLIEPADHWQAELHGEPFGQLKIHVWQVKCDVCQTTTPLEFVSRSEDSSDEQVFHAETRLVALGWKKSEGQHICPGCAKTH